MGSKTRSTAVFRVLDAMEHPHGGAILRLRLQDGDAPSVGDLENARLRALSPDGDERIVKVEGFAALGGKHSDARLARTGRADLHVLEDDGEDGPAIEIGWSVSGPVS
ncbi:MAG: hypothetical protein ACLFWG_00640 [Longimicrobiales bacterium]